MNTKPHRPRWAARWSFALLSGIASLTNLAYAQATSCVAPPPGMIGWWPGDGNGADLVGVHPATLSGGAMYLPGKVGQAFHFPGTGGKANMGAVGNFATSDFTVDFWVRTSKAALLQAIVGKRETCARSNFWEVRTNQRPGFYDAGLVVELGADATQYVLLHGTKAVNDGVFHHVAMVRAGAQLLLYFDGELDATGTTPGGGTIHMSNLASLIAGDSACTRIDGTNPLDGQIDELELFTRALSAAEIQALYQSGSKGKCKGAQVSLRIVYGSKDNPSNPALIVAILGSPTFNATTVSPASVTLGGMPVKMVGTTYLCSNVDIDQDGIADKMCLIAQPIPSGVQVGQTLVLEANTPSMHIWGQGTVNPMP